MSTSWARRTVASILSLTLMVSFLALGEGRADAALCNLVPQLRDATVNQGLGSYSPLAYGKTTLFRAYLSLPTCAAPTDAIEVRGGTLSVSVPGKAAVPVAATPAPTTPYAQVASYISAPALDAPADLKFAVPGSALTNTAGTAFTGTFSLSVSYAWRNTSTSPWTAASTNITTLAGQTSAISSSVAKPTNNLRVLVVPVGDASASMSTQYPPVASTALQNGMNTLSRLFPVRDGVGDLATAGNGIRYNALPALLDAGDPSHGGLGVMSGGVLCINGNSWDILKGALAQRLQAWNSQNTNAQADRVLGVVWDGIAGPSSCADGLSHVGGAEAIVRLKADGSTPSNAGAVIAHELAHTLGGVPTPPGDGGYHSKNQTADGTAPNRDYNVTTRQFLGTTDRSVMYPGTNADNVNGLFEQSDYALAQCSLTPGATGCPLPGSVGTSAAGPAIVVAGTTDGTTEGTNLSTYFDGNAERTADDPTSPYHLVQFKGSTQVRDSRIRAKNLLPSESLGGPATTVAKVALDVAVDLDVTSPADSFAITKDGGGTLYSRNLDTAPSFKGQGAFGSLQVKTLGNYTASAGNDVQPALTPDGTYVAWVDAAGIRVRAVDKTTPVTPAGALAGSEPAWSQAKDGLGNWHLLFTTAAGDIRDVAVSTSNGASLGVSQTLYSATPVPGTTAPASHATYNPDGTKVVVSIGGDLWRLDLTSPFTANSVFCQVDAVLPVGCSHIINTPGTVDKNPSLSPSSVIAYESGTSVAFADTNGGTTGTPPSIANATNPTWGGAVLAYVQGGKILAKDGSSTVTLTSSGADTWPALDSTTSVIAFDRNVGGQHDIFTGTLGRNVVSATVSDPDTGAVVRLDVFVRCGTFLFPLLTNLPPTMSSGGDNYFVVNMDPSANCSGGTTVLRATDGWSTATADDGSTGAQHDPVGAIYSPPAGSAWLQFDAIPVSGLGLDTEDRSLPDASLQWSRSPAPGMPATLSFGTGRTLPDLQPPVGGWATGVWTIKLTVTDSAGRTSSTSVTYTIFPDADHDGIRADKDKTCGGANADNDPTNADADPDHDGIATRDDPAPCTSANNATVNFDPDTLNTGSTGTPVTLYINFTSGDLNQVPRTNVRIVQIGNYATNFVAMSWSANSASSGMAQFDRTAINSFLIQNGLKGMYVPFVVTGSNTTPTFTFRGVDASSPITS